MTVAVEDYNPRHPLTAKQRRWLEHIRAAQTSGLSNKAYAAREGLSLSAMYACKSLLREKGYLPSPKVTLVPAQVPSPAPSYRSAELRIHLPNGIVIDTAASAPVESVVELARALR